MLSFGDRRLINSYSVMAVSKNPHPEVNEEAGRAFVDWITSDEVQALIGAFRESGQLLFTPVAGLR